MGPILSLEGRTDRFVKTSVTNRPSTLRNIPEDREFQYIFFFFFFFFFYWLLQPTCWF
jgi:hypothetical protein